MEKTFGPVLFDMIKRKIPKERCIRFDTRKRGRRPDTMKMLRDVYDAFDAEGTTANHSAAKVADAHDSRDYHV